MREVAQKPEFGDGPLSRAAAVIYWYIVLTVLLALTCVPAVAVVFFLDRAASNVGFVVLSALPVGPALAATLFATRARATAENKNAPARAFWRGYRLNFVDVLKVWTPTLLVLGIIAYVLANLETAELSGGYAIVLALIGVTLAVVGLHAVAIASLFSFRTRDVARLSVYYLGRRKLASLGVLALLVVAFGILWYAGEFVLAALGGVWVWFWYRNLVPIADDIQAQFVVKADEPVSGTGTA